MAPKAKTPVKKAPPPAAPDTSGVHGGDNTDINVRIQKIRTRLDNWTMFKGIADEQPLSIKDGASLPPFELKDLRVAIDNGTTYGPVGCNFFWLSWLKSPTPGVRVIMSNVKKLTNHYYGGGEKSFEIARIAHTFEVAVQAFSILYIVSKAGAGTQGISLGISPRVLTIPPNNTPHV